MSVTLVILGQHLLNGVLIGCAYALIAMGLTMIFGVMNIANFAHGEFYMLGGFLAFYLVSLMGLNYFAALPLAVVLVVALAVVLQHVIFRRLRNAPTMTTTLVLEPRRVVKRSCSTRLTTAAPGAAPAGSSTVTSSVFRPPSSRCSDAHW